ncbi:hypothetical protein [Spirosoma lituiforme]
MQRTLQQNSRFHTLLTLRKFDREDKAELVKACTDGRTTSSSDMSIDEMAKAIEILDDEQTTSIKKMRAKIIHIGRDIFDLRPRDAWEQVHYDKLNTFLFGKFKAPLHKLSYLKLIDAVTAMEKWRESETKKMVNNLLNAI